MLDPYNPYHMVFINLIVFILFILGILFYKYIFPKRNINLFVLLILISSISLISLLRPGDYESGDFNIHYYRSIEFYNSLKEGNLMPSWTGVLNHTYGMPLFIFNYPLPYYILSLFHFLGLSFLASMKLFLALNFLLSGIFMYLCAKKLFKSNLAAFTVAIFYLFVPYHLIDLHFTIAIGEVLVFTLIPLVFLLLQKTWENRNRMLFLVTTLSVALLIMSHVSHAFFVMVLFMFYSIFLSFTEKKKYFAISTFIIFTLASLCTLYIWLTPFILNQYTIVPKLKFTITFPQFWELLYSPYRYGLLFQGPQGEISRLLGYTHLFVVLSLLILLFRKKLLHKSKIIFWVAAFIFFVFLMTQFSAFLWNTFPFLASTGGPYRFLVLTSFVSSILAGYFCVYFKKKTLLIWLVIGITIFSTIINWGHRHVIPEHDDTYLINNLFKSKYLNDGHYFSNTKWRPVENAWFSEIPKAHLETIKGVAEIKDLKRTSTMHTYIINAKSQVSIRENTLYFPGWQVYANYEAINTKPDNQGIISFNLPKGLHYVEVIYQDIYIYKLLKYISVTGIALTTVMIILLFLKYRLAK